MDRRGSRREQRKSASPSRHYGANSPISSQPLRRHMPFQQTHNLSWLVPRPSPIPQSPKTAPAFLTQAFMPQRLFRPHSVKRKLKPSPSPVRDNRGGQKGLVGPQVQTSQWTLERINSLLQLRRSVKISRRDYVSRKAERAKTAGRERKVTKDQGSGTTQAASVPEERVRPHTTGNTRRQHAVLPRPHSEARFQPPAAIFQNESIRDWCAHSDVLKTTI